MLSKYDKRFLVFSESPARKSSYISTKSIIEEWDTLFYSSNPNGALVDSNGNSFAFSISNVQVKSGGLYINVLPIEGSKIKEDNYKDISFFIDDGLGEEFHLSIQNQTDGHSLSIEPYVGDSTEPFNFKGRPFYKGEANTVSFTVKNDLAHYPIGLKLIVDGDQSNYCILSPNYTCFNTSTAEHGGGFNSNSYCYIEYYPLNDIKVSSIQDQVILTHDKPGFPALDKSINVEVTQCGTSGKDSGQLKISNNSDQQIKIIGYSDDGSLSISFGDNSIYVDPGSYKYMSARNIKTIHEVSFKTNDYHFAYNANFSLGGDCDVETFLNPPHNFNCAFDPKKLELNIWD